jgi:hypothetical protein
MNDTWTTDGTRTTAPALLARLRQIIDDESPLIVEHRLYRRASSPNRFICDDFEVLEAYLTKEARPGDSFWFWRFVDCCRDNNAVADAKVPDADGCTPRGGAY